MTVRATLLALLAVAAISPAALAAPQSGAEGAALYRRFEACAPSLSPFQQQRFETLSLEQRERFLGIHCDENESTGQAPANGHEPPATAHVTIAVVEIENEANIPAGDKRLLDDLVLTTLEELPRERFSIIRITRDWARYCELACLRDEARDAGAAYVVLGSIQPVGNQRMLRLRLYRTTDDQLVASAVTDGVSEVGELVRPTVAATNELLEREPFRTPPPNPVTSPQRPPRPPPTSWRVQVVPTEAFEPIPRRRGPSGLRIAAHIVFWPGMVILGAGVAVLATTGDETTGLSSAIIGGALAFSGTICGMVHLSRRRLKTGSQFATVQPLVSPDFTGLGYALVF